MCDDSGTILDDGTVSRLAEDRFFVTTTTGNIEFVEQWLKWWSAGPTMRVYITNITAGFGAVNVAGPDARTLLGKLTSGDLSSAQFPYMSCTQWEVAGVPALLLRVGFVGETGWEIHFPAEYGEYLWDTILDAGKELSVEPFGVEAQRVLRLEKKHIIVGHDTDALSNPLEADMPWAVKFEKQDFIGKRSLLALRERGLRNVLVGLELHDAQGAEDGSPVLWKGKSAGRVTSIRRSSTLERFVALAWVPVEQSHEGAEVAIRGVSGEARARVTRQPFYDPKGIKLRG
jgi:sarcosine oxidase subunit alpha